MAELRYQTEEERRITHEANRIKQQKKKKLMIIFGSIFCVLVAAVLVTIFVIVPGNKYQKAMEAKAAEDYQTAFELLGELGDYKDAKAQREEIELVALKETFRNAQPGDIVTFGAYEQDNETENGKEDLEWIVLDVQDNRALLLTEKVVEGAPFNENYIGVTWEECTLRTMLNTEFLEEAFSPLQQTLIPTVTLDNSIVVDAELVEGPTTEDRVFLLSVDEVEKYFPDITTREAFATKLAKKHYAYANAKYYYNTWWWLRTAGYTNWEAAIVFNDGRIMNNIQDEYTIFVGVRPAIYVDFS